MPTHQDGVEKAESTVQPAMLGYSSTSQFVIHFVSLRHDGMKLIYCGVLFLKRVDCKAAKHAKEKRNHYSVIEH